MDNKKVQLEELLKLKRNERPSSQDWEMFDAKLQQKILCCIVKESAKDKILSRPLFKYTVASSAVMAAVATFVIPVYFSSVTIVENSQSSVTRYSYETLPALDSSFSVNELPIESSNNYNMMADSDDIRYVSNDVGGIPANVFTF